MAVRTYTIIDRYDPDRMTRGIPGDQIAGTILGLYDDEDLDNATVDDAWEVQDRIRDRRPYKQFASDRLNVRIEIEKE